MFMINCRCYLFSWFSWTISAVPSMTCCNMLQHMLLFLFVASSRRCNPFHHWPKAPSFHHWVPGLQSADFSVGVQIKWCGPAPRINFYTCNVGQGRVWENDGVPCVGKASSLTTRRDVFLVVVVVVGFAEICGLAIFTRFRGVKFLRCTWLGTGMLKLCLCACNLTRQVHHAGRLSWAFSNAPWSLEIISGCILEVKFFWNEAGWFRPCCENRPFALVSGKKLAESRLYIFPGASTWMYILEDR